MVLAVIPDSVGACRLRTSTSTLSCAGTSTDGAPPTAAARAMPASAPADTAGRRRHPRHPRNFFRVYALLVLWWVRAAGLLVADRRGQVVLLLLSSFDWLWLPGSRRTASGFGEARRGLCVACEGRGEVVDRFGRVSRCGGCGGAGRVALDPMDVLGVPVRTAELAPAREHRTKECDGCGGLGIDVRREDRRCRYCDGEGRRVAPLLLELGGEEDFSGDDVLDQFGRMMDSVERRNAAGSYHELDVALAGFMDPVDKVGRFGLLATGAVLARRLIDEVYLLGLCGEEDLGADDRRLLELGLAYLVSRMPDPIRVPGEIGKNAKLRRDWRTRARGRGAAPLSVRDAEIRKLARVGKPVQWIAQEYGLSVSAVYAIGRGST